MIRYLIWYIDKNGNKGRFNGHAWYLGSSRPRPQIPEHGWWFKTKDEAMHVVDLLRKDSCYTKVWITKHNT